MNQSSTLVSFTNTGYHRHPLVNRETPPVYIEKEVLV